MTFRKRPAWQKAAEAGEMWLTHYSPSLVRPEDYMEEVYEIFPECEAGA